MRNVREETISRFKDKVKEGKKRGTSASDWRAWMQSKNQKGEQETQVQSQAQSPMTQFNLVGLHDAQRIWWEHPARYRVIAAGRRAGKTLFGVLACMDVALHGGRAWWVAPSYKISEIGWRDLSSFSKQVAGTTIREADNRVTFGGGGWVEVRTAHDPDLLRGEGLDLVVFDEAAYVKERAWTEAVRPALADRKGRAIFISTPAGRDWFWKLWLRGQDIQQQEWVSWQYPSAANPKMSVEEVEEARRSLPERIFRQEFLAEFIEDGGVFRYVQEAVSLDPPQREDDSAYVIGVDWGRSHDYSCFVVLDIRHRRVVEVDRSNQVEYRVQRGRLRALAERWRPLSIIVEANSIGEPVIEQLRRAEDGLPPLAGIRAFHTTNSSKAEIVDALALAFERHALTIPNDPILLGELLAFNATRLPSGAIRYAAPEGMHDDTVIALALANWGAGIPATATAELGPTAPGRFAPLGKKASPGWSGRIGHEPLPLPDEIHKRGRMPASATSATTPPRGGEGSGSGFPSLTGGVIRDHTPRRRHWG